MKQNEYKIRRDSFFQQMDENSFALFSSGKAPFKLKDQVYPFAVNRNFYYLTGLMRENFILLLLRDKLSFYAFLFIEEPSEYATKWLGNRMTKEEASKISGIRVESIMYLREFDEFIAKRILIDTRSAVASMPNKLYLDLSKEHVMKKPFGLISFQTIVDVYPELQILDASTIIDNLRRIKSTYEIDEIKKAIHYTNKGIQALMKNVKAGMNEGQLEALFEYTIKVEGSKGTSFNTISASGKNATVLHYEDNNCVIKNNTLVLTDLGALSSNYAADITRTYPANGVFTNQQKQFYQLVLDVNKTIIDMIKPGVYISDLNKKATNLLAEGMKKLGKITNSQDIIKYYYHSVSHYLGLDVHDVGTYNLPLEPGVVLTVEPGIYVGDEAIGIRIEDDILVTETGYINLSEEIIKEIEDIELFMKK